jgi:molecular chaperone GrpE
MINRQALMNQLFEYLDTVPDAPEYLIGAPEIADTFDPYQMVGEWIALRQEVKQQNKLMQSSQQTLQQALQQVLVQAQSETQAQANTPSTSEEPTHLKQDTDRGLIKELLSVMDALDSAIDHNLKQVQTPSQDKLPILKRNAETNYWTKVLEFLGLDQESKILSDPSSVSEDVDHDLKTILNSHQLGIEMIRRSLLEILQKRQVKPMNAVGQPFDAQCMYAIAQQSSDRYPANTVIQEVVRGYWNGDRILREAQVIVASQANSL